MKRMLVIAAVVSMALSGCEEPVVRFIPDDYDTWERTTLADLTEPIPGHPPGLRRIYINPVGTQVTPATDGERVTWDYPEGTIVVKENYAGTEPAEGEDPAFLYAMVKAPDDERSRGGWLWIARDYDSLEETIFDNEFCVTCHADANEVQTNIGDPNIAGDFRDYLFYPYEPAE